MNWRPVLTKSVATLVCACPLLAVVYSVHVLSRLDEPVSVADHEATITPTSGLFVQSTAAELRPDWSTPSVVYAPQWTGTVTSFGIVPQQSLSALDVVVQIDGLERIGWSSDSWFYRRLRYGDRGRDVAELQLFLASQAYELLADELGLFGAATRVAVKEFEAKIGLSKPTGIFEPSWLVRLPVDPFIVAEVSAQVGNPAPPSGTVLMKGAPGLSGANVTVIGEPIVHAAGDDNLVAILPDGSEVGVDRNGNVIGAGLAILAKFLSAQESTQVADQALGGNAVLVELRQATDSRGWILPATAIDIDAKGGTCVYVESSSRGSYNAIPVVVKADGLAPSTVFVEAEFSAQDHVIVSPRLEMGRAPCE